MTFPLGKPIFAMILTSLLSGGALLCLPKPAPSALTLWVFADSHARIYRTIQDQFERQSGKTLAIETVGDSINLRLSSLFMAGRTGHALPDAAEIEIGNIGKFFRPPLEDVGFLPLNDYLENSGFRTIPTPAASGQQGWNARCITDGKIYTYDGSHWQFNPSRARPDAWIDRIVPARLTPWSKHGVIFGVPHDVHPVTLTYRDDLFREAGIDLSTATTWPDFRAKCVVFQRYWLAHGYSYRHALELPANASDDLVNMLLQRHVDLVDDREHIHLADPKVVQTLSFYAQLAAGPERIGSQTESNTGLWIHELELGNICCFWTPDWRVDLIRQYAHADMLRGRLRMMALPRFDPGDAPTSTWGGTMIGIPRNCADPDGAWKLIEFLYFSQAGSDAQRADSEIITPIMERWSDPFYQLPDPYFEGQKIRALYVDLARQIPARTVTPMSTVAEITLSVVLGRAVDYVRNHGTVGLDDACQHWLNDAAADVQRRTTHGSFEQETTAQ